MLYELALVVRPELHDQQLESTKKIIHDVVNSYSGEIFVEDDWGRLRFAMPTNNGTTTGHFFYFVYAVTAPQANTEILRRLKINESVIRQLIVKVADSEQNGATFVKNLKIPYSKRYRGSVTDALDNSSGNLDKERKQFSKRKNCWFTACKIRADWKDPQTFSWLINEFGKISPARVSGISRKHQRFATTTIKRARQIGISSYVSNRLAE